MNLLTRMPCTILARLQESRRGSHMRERLSIAVKAGKIHHINIVEFLSCLCSANRNTSMTLRPIRP